jgi:lysophospholipase L1-like esterase
VIKYPDPVRVENALSDFEAQDRVTSPPQGAIVCFGSSSMRGWHKTIVADLAPLTVIPRGFGGSTMHDALHFADRVVTAYRPRAVVVYEGDNDIAMGIPAEKVFDSFAQLVSRIRQTLPDSRIYFLSIKPSPSRWNKWEEMTRANTMIRDFCTTSPGMMFIDVATPMLDASGNPKPEIYLKDKLHMNADGYRIWADAVKPMLMEKEAKFEPAPATAP